MNVMSDPESKRTLRDQSNTCPWSKWIKIIEIGDNVLSIPFKGLLMSLGDLSLLLFDLLSSSLLSHMVLSSLKTSAIVSRRYVSSTAARNSGVETFAFEHVCQSRFISFTEGVARIDGAGHTQVDVVVAIERLFEATESNAVIVVVSSASAFADDRKAMFERCSKHTLVFGGKFVESDGS